MFLLMYSHHMSALFYSLLPDSYQFSFDYRSNYVSYYRFNIIIINKLKK